MVRIGGPAIPTTTFARRTQAFHVIGTEIAFSVRNSDLFSYIDIAGRDHSHTVHTVHLKTRIRVAVMVGETCWSQEHLIALLAIVDNDAEISIGDIQIP